MLPHLSPFSLPRADLRILMRRRSTFYAFIQYTIDRIFQWIGFIKAAKGSKKEPFALRRRKEIIRENNPDLL
jgi:hypothetical protein